MAHLHLSSVESALHRLRSSLARFFRGSSKLAAALGLFAPPLRDGRVVAAQQDLRHLHAAEHPRPGVLRVLQPARVRCATPRPRSPGRPARRARSGSPCRSPPSPAPRRRCRRSRRPRSPAASAPAGCGRRTPRTGRTAAAAACVASSSTTGCVSRSPAGRQHHQQPGARPSPAPPRPRRRPARASAPCRGPPPKGRSSTLLCLPFAQSRMFHRWISTSPRWIASFSRLCRGSPGRSPGTGSARRSGSRRRLEPRLAAGGGGRRPSAGGLRRPWRPSGLDLSHFSMYFLRSTCTFSDGWRPTLSQYLMRSA